jgi:hypothetical protein
MAKKLFKNYSFTFDKNERKVLTTFCKQALKQMYGNPELAKQAAIFDSILKKLESENEEVKLTKNEKYVLTASLKENVKFLKDKTENGSFFTKWFYKSVLRQYESLVSNHFED